MENRESRLQRSFNPDSWFPENTFSFQKPSDTYNLAHMALSWCADHPETLKTKRYPSAMSKAANPSLRCWDGFRFKLLNSGDNYPFVVPLHTSTHLCTLRGKPKPPEGGRWLQHHAERGTSPICTTEPSPLLHIRPWAPHKRTPPAPPTA